MYFVQKLTPLYIKTNRTYYHVLWVTIDGVWIDDSIYWLFLHTTRDYNLEFIVSHSLVSLVNYSLH
jgi:hypothetical protein